MSEGLNAASQQLARQRYAESLGQGLPSSIAGEERDQIRSGRSAKALQENLAKSAAYQRLLATQANLQGLVNTAAAGTAAGGALLQQAGGGRAVARGIGRGVRYVGRGASRAASAVSSRIGGGAAEVAESSVVVPAAEQGAAEIGGVATRSAGAFGTSAAEQFAVTQARGLAGVAPGVAPASSEAGAIGASTLDANIASNLARARATTLAMSTETQASAPLAENAAFASDADPEGGALASSANTGAASSSNAGSLEGAGASAAGEEPGLAGSSQVAAPIADDAAPIAGDAAPVVTDLAAPVVESTAATLGESAAAVGGAALDALGPIGILAGVGLAIFGAVEASKAPKPKKPEQPKPTAVFTPSRTQFGKVQQNVAPSTDTAATLQGAGAAF